MRIAAAIVLLFVPAVAHSESVRMSDRGYDEVVGMLTSASGSDREIFGVDLSRLTRPQMLSLAKLDPRNRIMFAWPMRGDASIRSLRLLHTTGLLRKISRLALNCGDECVQIVAGSRHAVGIRELAVTGCVGDEYLPHVNTASCYYASTRTAALIAHSNYLAKVRTLTIASLGKAVRVLLSGNLKLSTLDLTTDDSGVRAVARSRKIRTLVFLRLFGLGFTEESISAVVRSPHLRDNLRVLDLHGSDSEAEHVIGAAHLVSLARDMRLTALRYLDVSWNYGMRGAVRELVVSPWLTQLEGLCFYHTGWKEDPRVEKALVDRAPWPRLQLMCEHECPTGFEKVCDPIEAWEETVRAMR